MYIRKAEPKDFEVFTPAYHDVLEAQAMGITPRFPDVSECVTLDLDGYPLAIGGNDEARVWFVTSDRVWRLDRASKLTFRDHIMEYRDMMLDVYPVIWNFVWTGNGPHLRFLKSIGAVFHEEYSQDGKFKLFTIRG